MIIAPGAVSVAMTAFGKMLPRDQEIVPSIIGVLAALLLSVVVSFFLMRRAESVGQLIGFGMLLSVGLAILNFAIAFAGCAAMNPHMDFR